MNGHSDSGRKLASCVTMTEAFEAELSEFKEDERYCDLPWINGYFAAVSADEV